MSRRIIRANIDIEATKKALMKFHKETIIDAYISAKIKADEYDVLKEILIRMIKDEYEE